MRVQLINETITKTAKVISLCGGMLIYDYINYGSGFVQRSVIHPVIFTTDEALRTALRDVHATDVTQPKEVTLLQDFKSEVHLWCASIYYFRHYHFTSPLLSGQ
ncbi:MAG: hypothetical protein IJ192_13230 [Clostridia bacterium]|nr:hypothetical protein [Clostridia bacterium]